MNLCRGCGMKRPNMRSALVALIFVVACGDNIGAKQDSGTHHIDSAPGIDAKVFEDAAPPMIVDGTIGDVRAAADGSIGIKLTGVTVTYVKPQVGDPTSDPAGFTIQTDPTGPAIFVAIDPATLNPVPGAGDVVTVTALMKTTVSGQPRIAAVQNFSRTSQGADLTALTQNITTATDLVTAAASYDSELVTVTGTLKGTAGSSGAGFSRLELDTTAITATPALQVRVPTAVMTAIDMTTNCNITITAVPFSIFTSGTATNAEVDTFNTSEFTLSGCAAPVVQKAVATAAMKVRVTFSRNVLNTSVLTDGSQFTLSGGLVVDTGTAPVVSGHTVTLTVTTAQTPLTAYTVTVANTVTDLQGSPVAMTLAASFLGYTAPASAVINEINGTELTSCDLVELRVTADGSLGNFRLAERDGSTSNYTLPPTLQVHKNDFVIIHLGGTAGCNPGGAVDELAGDPMAQLHATYARNFDTAFDIYAPTGVGGITGTTSVLTLFDPADTIVDAVFLTDGTSVASATTLGAAAIVGTAVMWEPHATSYTDATFQAAAVPGMKTTTTGIAPTDTSIQRLNNTDTNAAADWTAVPVVQTWGALNVGQTAL